MLDDLVCEVAVSRRIDDIEASADDGDRAALCLERAAMRSAIYAQRHAADDA